ncbi:dephospho-CoA kinase [Chromatiales bacterium (ex Bugula neritina AB1)]|nr:dephospho-CoA kinase [Chromatiales bacterium (ex Bugula neritina AB1)]
MLRVALSGGIASGKTTVSNAFSELGVPVVDADLLSRVAVQPASAGLKKIVARFGNDILQDNGSLNRSALRTIVFNDQKARSDLEGIIHPEIRKLTDSALQIHQREGSAYAIIVIPLLVETGQAGRYDHIIIVDIDRQTQIDRLLQRDGGCLESAEKILASQATREQRLAVADDVISNEGSKDKVIEQVKRLHEKLTKLAAES